MSTAWYVTSIMHPEHPLDGPYDSRADCAKQCLLLVSDATRQRMVTAILNGAPVTSVGISYVPRPFFNTMSALPAPAPMPTSLPRAQHVNAPPDLLAKLRALPRSKLLRIAATIQMEVPESLEHNKAALATCVHNFLLRSAGST